MSFEVFPTKLLSLLKEEQFILIIEHFLLNFLFILLLFSEDMQLKTKRWILFSNDHYVKAWVFSIV